MAERYYSSQLKFIILIGIGGSNLGTKAVYDALRGQLDLLSQTTPKIIFLDTTSVTLIRDIEDVLGGQVLYKEQILVNLVSKSGATTESIVNFELLMAYLLKHVEGIEERVGCTTNLGSRLWKMAEKRKYGLLPIPKMVGGRFSVFSSVGIFPLLLCGIDVVSLREGAKDMLLQCLSSDTQMHHARRSAEILFAEMTRGISIFNIFHFAPELESLGKWDGLPTSEPAGTLPVRAMGAVDQHSQLQLYLESRRDKFFTFIELATWEHDLPVPLDPVDAKHFPYLKGKSMADVIGAEFHTTRQVITDAGHPNMTIRLPALDAHILGQLIDLYQRATVYAGLLYGVNPLDQPSVEKGKQFAIQLLRSMSDT